MSFNSLPRHLRRGTALLGMGCAILFLVPTVWAVTPPSASIGFPVGGPFPSVTTVSGTAFDTDGMVTLVQVRLRDTQGFHAGEYWTGSSWTATTETWLSIGPFAASSVNWQVMQLPTFENLVLYELNARAQDDMGLFSAVYATATFSVDSGGGAGTTTDNPGGQGAAAVLPNSALSCALITATFTFTVQGSAFSQDGGFLVRIPDGWPDPVLISTGSGFVSATTTVGGVSLLVDPDPPSDFLPSSDATERKRWVATTLSAGTLSVGSTIQLFYLDGFTGSQNAAGEPLPFSTRSRPDPSFSFGDLTPYPTMQLTAGAPKGAAFTPDSPFVVEQSSPSVAMRVELFDDCGNPAAVGTDTPVFLSAVQAGLPVALSSFSAVSAFSPLITQSTVPPSSGLSNPFFFKTDASGTVDIHAEVFGVGLAVQSVQVQPAGSLSNAFSSLSVDTGTFQAGQTLVTISPNQDGIADSAFIRFQLSNEGLQWRVSFTSVPALSPPPIVFDLSGFGSTLNNPVFWNGRNFEGFIVPNATYTARVEIFNAGVSTDVLKVRVRSAFIEGKVQNMSTGEAFVQANGSAGSFGSAKTDSSGDYSVPGLVDGNAYTLIAHEFNPNTGAQKEGKRFNIVALSTGALGIDIALSTPTRIRVAAVLPSTVPVELWGFAEAHTADFSRFAGGPLHFVAQSTISDNGNFGNFFSTWTALFVSTGVYTLRAELPFLGVSSQTTVDLTGPLDFVFNFSGAKKSAAFGWVVFPSTRSQETPVDVEAIKIGENFPSRFGQVSVQVNRSSAVYSLFGLESTTYTLVARSFGVVPATASLCVSCVAQGTDIGSLTNPLAPALNFPPGAGGLISGTVQLAGSTSGLPDPVRIFISAYNPNTRLMQGFVEVPLFLNSPSGPYQIGGLEPGGTYQIFAHREGFELTQPASPHLVTLSGSSLNQNLTLTRSSGTLMVTILGVSGQDWSLVDWEIRGPGIEPGSGFFSPASSVEGSSLGGTFAPFASSATVKVTRLGTSFYDISAFNRGTGARAFRRVGVVNGQSAFAILDVSGTGASVSGVVTLRGSLSLNLGNNFIVSVSSIPGLTAHAAFDGGLATTTARVELIRREFGEFHQGFEGDSGAGTVLFGAIRPDGSYQIERVPPGVYLLRNRADLDAVTGPEVARVEKVVTVLSTALTGQDLELSQGVSISGSVSFPPGVQETRSVDLVLRNIRGEEVRSQNLSFNNVHSLNFTLNRIADGVYTLEAVDFGTPRIYAAKPLRIQVQGTGLQNQNPSFQKAGRMKAKIIVQQIKVDGTVESTAIGASNLNLLPEGFQIFAVARPWFDGGFREADRQSDSMGPPILLLDSQGKFIISGLLPGTYDVVLKQDSFSSLFQGQGKFNLAPLTVAGVAVAEGQTVDLGELKLRSGVTVRGTVKDASGAPLPNIRVIAVPAARFEFSELGLEAATDGAGNYSLAGLDPDVAFYDLIAAPRLRAGDFLAAPSAFGEVVKANVDIRSVSSVNFTLSPALGTIVGKVAIPDPAGPPLRFPEGERTGFPGALLFALKQGEIPRSGNPFGDIDVLTDFSGNFHISSLSPGTYQLTAASLDYASAQKTVSVPATASQGPVTVNAGTLTLSRGAALSGRLTKPDGTFPRREEVGFIAAVSPNLDSLLFGGLTIDPSANLVREYAISGFQPNVTYRIVTEGEGQEITVLTEVRFSSATEKRVLALVLQPKAPPVFARSLRSGQDFLVRFDSPQALRNRTGDSNLGQIVQEVSGGGDFQPLLASDPPGISLDRRVIHVRYRPAATDKSFQLRFQAFTDLRDPAKAGTSDPEFLVISTFTFFVGVDAARSNRISNITGGELTLEGDPTKVQLPAGAFQAAVDTSAVMELRKADEPGLASGQGLRFSKEAYPQDFLRALDNAPEVSPLSAFYDIFLPLGVRTLSKPALLTIHYDTAAVTDPARLNVYWFNDGDAANPVYVRQDNLCAASPSVDSLNQTITICVDHFSTFVLLDNNVPVIEGETFSGGEVSVFNFPNPFDLKTKTLSLTRPAGGGPTSLTTEGTAIRFSLPAGVSGDVTIQVFNVVGERVRALDLGFRAAGKVHYTAWDGRNDSGRQVASGVYIGELKVGGKEKFFKMAVIK